MIIGLFALGFVIYFLNVWAMYTPAIKDHAWYVPGSMIFGFCFSWVWPLVVKLTPTADQVYIRGMLWDSMLVGCYAFLPFLFGFKPTAQVLIGGAVTVIGLLIMKLGGS